MMVTGGHGVRMRYDYTGDIAGPPGAVSAASPRWLRLTRSEPWAGFAVLCGYAVLALGLAVILLRSRDA